MPRLPLILAAAAVALLVVLVLLARVAGSRYYEANYTLVFVFESSEGRQVFEVGWLLVGVGPENYTVAVMRASGVALSIYEATEGGGSRRSVICVGGVCRPFPLDGGVIPAAYGEAVAVGSCEHIGRRGALYRYEGVPEELARWLSLISAVGGTSARGSASAEACLSGGVVLWLRGGVDLEVAGRRISMALWLNATRVGPYNATRYQEVLNRVKNVR